MRVDADGLLDELGLLTVAEAAARVGVPRKTIYSWVAAGSVTVVREGRRLWVGERSLLDYELATRRSPMGRPRAGDAHRR